MRCVVTAPAKHALGTILFEVIQHIKPQPETVAILPVVIPWDISVDRPTSIQSLRLEKLFSAWRLAAIDEHLAKSRVVRHGRSQSFTSEVKRNLFRIRQLVLGRFGGAIVAVLKTLTAETVCGCAWSNETACSSCQAAEKVPSANRSSVPPTTPQSLAPAPPCSCRRCTCLPADVQSAPCQLADDPVEPLASFSPETILMIQPIVTGETGL